MQQALPKSIMRSVCDVGLDLSICDIKKKGQSKKIERIAKSQAFKLTRLKYLQAAVNSETESEVSFVSSGQ